MYLYPNPVNNTVNISVPNKWVINTLAYRIFDLTGNRCLSGCLDSRSINVSELPSSMYFIEIDTGTNVYLLKFLKQ
ncbi:MAG: T9SS type A sorting domain-containing protein [Flavobacteriales bacterium]|nr:T9SS type A sorting domain-containing protein [Flavobacteriales bacterium]